MGKKISILCEQFFMIHDNTKILMGGGERWLYDFVALLKKLNYDVTCYQFSEKEFTQRYKRMVIKGLGNIQGNPNDYHVGLDKFYGINKDTDGIFFLTMNLAQYKTDIPTITVSHGLWFDGAEPNREQMSSIFIGGYKNWVENSSHIISVDTNSIKLMQLTEEKLSFKMSYVPNYVNFDEFKPTENKTNKFTVLFPRRLQWCRGYTTMMSAIDILKEKYPNKMDFIFCGRGTTLEEDQLVEWINKDPKNIRYLWREMDKMASIYHEADISCVPTIMAEGTSLAALESLASGVPVIATIVGGLTDLVWNDVNGLLIKPDDSRSYNYSNSKYLVEAIEYAYLHPEDVKRWRDNALTIVKSFGKDRWEKEIAKVVKNIFGE
jgi:glycosyltransferase involved in cell wall biosynthesis